MHNRRPVAIRLTAELYPCLCDGGIPNSRCCGFPTTGPPAAAPTRSLPGAGLNSFDHRKLALFVPAGDEQRFLGDHTEPPNPGVVFPPATTELAELGEAGESIENFALVNVQPVVEGLREVWDAVRVQAVPAPPPCVVALDHPPERRHARAQHLPRPCRGEHALHVPQPPQRVDPAIENVTRRIARGFLEHGPCFGHVYQFGSRRIQKWANR